MIAMPLSIAEGLVCNFTPIKLGGYANMLMSNEQFTSTLNELILEYDLENMLHASPEQRLIYTMATSALVVHNLNTQREMLANLQTAPSGPQVAPQTNPEFKGL